LACFDNHVGTTSNRGLRSLNQGRTTGRYLQRRVECQACFLSLRSASGEHQERRHGHAMQRPTSVDRRKVWEMHVYPEWSSPIRTHVLKQDDITAWTR